MLEEFKCDLMATLIGLKLTCVKPKDFYLYVKSTLTIASFSKLLFQNNAIIPQLSDTQFPQIFTFLNLAFIGHN